MKRRQGSRYARRPRDISFMLWVKTLACSALDLGGCSGPIEADHAGRRPVGRKADDDTCIPLCRTHHVQRGSFSGPFRSWDRDQMRAWLDEQIASTRGRWSDGQGLDGVTF